MGIVGLLAVGLNHPIGKKASPRSSFQQGRSTSELENLFLPSGKGYVKIGEIQQNDLLASISLMLKNADAKVSIDGIAIKLAE